MTEQPTRIRTKAEEALASHFAALAGDDPMREIRADGVRRLHGAGPAAPPHRGVEIHRPPRADADAPAPAEPAPPADARSRARSAPTFSRRSTGRASSSSTAISCRRSPTWPGSSDDVDFASLGRFLADGGAILDRSLDPAEAPIFALNSAFVRDGAVLQHPRRREARAAAGDRARLRRRRRRACRRSATRSSVGAGAKATILQTFAGPDGVAYHTNVVTEMQIGDGADVRWVDGAGGGRRRRSTSSLLLPRLGGNVRFEPFAFAAGALVARSEIRIGFEGEGSQGRPARRHDRRAASSISTRRSSSTTRRRIAAARNISRRRWTASRRASSRARSSSSRARRRPIPR